MKANIWNLLGLVPTREQREYYEGIKWLVSGPRFDGKSTLLAVALIATALERPGEWVRLGEGGQPRRLDPQVDIVKRLVCCQPELQERVEYNAGMCAIRIKEDWKGDPR